MVLGINDPVLAVFLIAGALFIFGLYLLFRRTMLAFQEGAQGRNR
ncbi:DUF7859 family protein [Halocatena marina]|uniref:Uncharacterized protein n=1 Tax=Halocatena marina TaxID=2934937 RepID=A0ABD5YLW2_9EURY|nr:hypothetical protein [Halocatena marina]